MILKNREKISSSLFLNDSDGSEIGLAHCVTGFCAGVLFNLGLSTCRTELFE